MSTEKDRGSSVAPGNNISGSFVESSDYKFNKDDFPSGKLKVKKANTKPKAAEANGTKAASPTSTRSSSPGFDESIMRHFPDGTSSSMSMDTAQCKHCRKPILRPALRDHQTGCLKAKQEKARKKKEAKEEKQRAKQNADKADADADGKSDGENEIKVDSSKSGAARKTAVKNTNANNDDSGKKANKKRKADGAAGEDGDGPGGEKKKTKKLKKDEPKPPKAPKPKGPVDVERQCGVSLPNGGQCARSLTCKSHSMGAKRAVPGRSLPYDILLSQYQKKNQARQQKAALESNAPLYDEDDEFGIGGAGGGGGPGGVGGVPVDSESEKEAVMGGIAKGLRGAGGVGCRPIVTQTRAPMRRKYQLVRMKETLSNALSGNRALFNVGLDAIGSGGGGGLVNGGGAGAASAAAAAASAMMRGALSAGGAGGSAATSTHPDSAPRSATTSVNVNAAALQKLQQQQQAMSTGGIAAGGMGANVVGGAAVRKGSAVVVE